MKELTINQIDLISGGWGHSLGGSMAANAAREARETSRSSDRCNTRDFNIAMASGFGTGFVVGAVSGGGAFSWATSLGGAGLGGVSAGIGYLSSCLFR